MGLTNKQLPKLGFLYMDYVLRFFDHSNFKGWPNKIEIVTYHWKNDKARFIKEVKRKKIDVLIGNIPATAYETFREIARELPHVRFIPSLDTQFSNKSKENVTRFAWKYNLPIPKTYIYYNHKKADKFLKKATYPKIVKRSYGPSNYGGYFVHKVDSYKEAKDLFNEKKYHPVYVQDFVPMEADIRVMLIGHKPVCAFWRRAPEGEWLTNTSQGGSMDYMDVPKSVLDLAVKTSKAARAEYWACDIAYGKDGKVRILECATAFAAFPYIRDWIGQYLMWSLSEGRFKKPNIPMFNWEELGRLTAHCLELCDISSLVLSLQVMMVHILVKKGNILEAKEFIFISLIANIKCLMLKEDGLRSGQVRHTIIKIILQSTLRKIKVEKIQKTHQSLQMMNQQSLMLMS